MFLRKTIDTLDDIRGLDFIIISVGSNDITRLNIEEDIKKLNGEACEQAVTLVKIAEEASEKHNIDVFINQPDLIKSLRTRREEDQS